MRTQSALGCLLLIAACGAGEDEGIDEYYAASQASNALFNELANLPDTSPASLPASTTATYEGYVNAFVSGSGVESVSVLGEANVSVDFDAVGAVNGTATRFYDNYIEPLSGTLAISGNIDTATNDITAGISGNLSQYGTTYAIDGPLNGAVKRSDASGIFLEGVGTIEVGGSPVGIFDASLQADTP